MSNVLVVDDYADSVDILSMILESEHHEVHGADSAKSAMKQMQTWLPDLIISDFGMFANLGWIFVSSS